MNDVFADPFDPDAPLRERLIARGPVIAVLAAMIVLWARLISLWTSGVIKTEPFFGSIAWNLAIALPAAAIVSAWMVHRKLAERRRERALSESPSNQRRTTLLRIALSKTYRLCPYLILLLGAAQTGAQLPPQQLDTIRISAAARTSTSVVARTRSVEVLSRDDIRRLGARTVQDMLTRAVATDVLVRSPMSADLAIRGTSLGQVLVLVDGVRMTDRQTPHFDLDVALPLEQVERIEIVRGPASAQYGADAVGGVVNIVTVGSDASPTAELRGGTFGTASGSLMHPRIAASHERSNGHRAGTDYFVTQLRGSLGSAALGGSAGQAVRDFGANTFYGPYDSHERTATTTAEVHGERWLGGAFTGTARLSSRRHADQFTLLRTNPSFYRNRHISLQSVLTAVVRHDRNVAVGAEVEDARLTSARLGDRRMNTGAVFAQAAFTRSRMVSDLGIRSDWSDGFGTFVSPSLATSLRLSERVSLRASASRAFRAPSWTERYYSDPANEGNPDLDAERFLVGEIGARARWLDVALWARRGENVIDWVKPSATPTAKWETMNISSIDYRGLDASIAAPPMGGVTVSANAAFLAFDAENIDGYTGKYSLRPLTSAIGVRTDFARWKAVSFALDGRGFRRAMESETHMTGNAHLTVTRSRLALAVHLDNIANAAYFDVAGMAVPGRGVTVSASWH